MYLSTVIFSIGNIFLSKKGLPFFNPYLYILNIPVTPNPSHISASDTIIPSIVLGLIPFNTLLYPIQLNSDNTLFCISNGTFALVINFFALVKLLAFSTPNNL